ncbi:Aminomethyltransferase folate-binding domain-containing protein [Nemania sp. FL0916]|nr:Aminomethyltransferase folate-binding domain-containing protein [Nemania sp. FL0916]
MQILPRSAPMRALRSLPSTSLSSQATSICASCRLRQYQQLRLPQQRQRQCRSFTSSIPRRESRSTEAIYSAPTGSLPTIGHARLRSRRLISISGSDAPRFLQGLVTMSIVEWGNGHGNNKNENKNRGHKGAVDESVHWFYGGFLNAQGRVLHDVFIYPMPPLGSDSSSGSGSGGEEKPHFMIEVDAAQQLTLLTHLKRYKLRSKVSLRAVDEHEMTVWQVWQEDHDYENPRLATEAITRVITSPAQTPLGHDMTVVIPDLRAPGMGHRVLTTAAELDVHDGLGGDFAIGEPERPAKPVDELVYRIRRYLRGVPEGSAEINPTHALPMEHNLDVMGGIDFRKGCYVGQELTIRTRHRGVVRKRVLPVVLYGDSNDVPKPAALEYRPDAIPATLAAAGEGEGGIVDLRYKTIGRLEKKGRGTGMLLGTVGNIGLALCRVPIMTDLIVPNDNSALEYDPEAEFVVRKEAKATSSEDDGGNEREREDGEEVEAPPLKVKAFVPEWLRRRVGEDPLER